MAFSMHIHYGTFQACLFVSAGGTEINNAQYCDHDWHLTS